MTVVVPALRVCIDFFCGGCAMHKSATFLVLSTAAFVAGIGADDANAFVATTLSRLKASTSLITQIAFKRACEGSICLYCEQRTCEDSRGRKCEDWNYSNCRWMQGDQPVNMCVGVAPNVTSGVTVAPQYGVAPSAGGVSAPGATYVGANAPAPADNTVVNNSVANTGAASRNNPQANVPGLNAPQSTGPQPDPAHASPQFSGINSQQTPGATNQFGGTSSLQTPGAQALPRSPNVVGSTAPIQNQAPAAKGPSVMYTRKDVIYTDPTVSTSTNLNAIKGRRFHPNTQGVQTMRITHPMYRPRSLYGQPTYKPMLSHRRF